MGDSAMKTIYIRATDRLKYSTDGCNLWKRNCEKQRRRPIGIWPTCNLCMCHADVKLQETEESVGDTRARVRSYTANIHHVLFATFYLLLVWIIHDCWSNSSCVTITHAHTFKYSCIPPSRADSFFVPLSLHTLWLCVSSILTTHIFYVRTLFCTDNDRVLIT